MTDKIALIIPLRLTANTCEGEVRLRRIAATVPRDLYEILISDYGTLPEHAAPIRALEADGIRVVRHPSPGALFSIGHARDYGVQCAREKIVIFNDIDFLGTPDMYRAIHAEAMRRDIGANMFDFFCVPVLFLTESGTHAWFSATGEGRPLLDRLDADMLETATDMVQFTAFGSSAMVVNRHHYMALGGHDSKFSGHGAEDYDLLHRLAALAPKAPRPNAYFVDFKDNGVRNYWGFRAFFALYGLDVFARGLHLVHLWHPRRAEKGYFRSGPNFRHLRKLMHGFDTKSEMPPPLTDPEARDRWLLVYRTRDDLQLARQLLPFSGSYRLLKAKRMPTGASLERLAGSDAKVIAVMPDVAASAESPLSGQTKLLQIRHDNTADAFRVTLTCAGSEPEIRTLTSATLTSPEGRVLYRYWPQWDVDAPTTFASGLIPAREPAEASLFATFGGSTMLDSRLHPRPHVKKKSTLWVKLKRRLTGY